MFVDNSMLQSIMTCPKQGALKTSLRLRLKKERAALFFGKVVHLALEARALEDSGIVSNEVEQKMFTVSSEAYDDWPIESNDYRNLSYCLTVLKKYNEKYLSDPHPPITLPGSEELAVELPFAIPLGTIELDAELWTIDPDRNEGRPEFRQVSEIQIVFTGKIDRITKRNGKLYLLDHKTTSMGGAGYFDEFYTGLQFKGYKFAAEHLLKQPVHGVIIDAIFSRKPTRTGQGVTFERHPIQFAPSHIDEWRESFLRTVQHFIDLHIDQETAPPDYPDFAFPSHTTWCKGKYGKCEFYDVCQLKPENRDALLFSPLYEDDDWDPLNEAETSKKEVKFLDPTDIFSVIS